MCGIVGIVGDTCNASLAKAMADALQHRGPDGDGYWSDDRVALGHRRLSIIDIEGGAQPMISASGRWVLIFNGEIYNYQQLRRQQFAAYPYKTTSDTEVVLAALELEGEQGLVRLGGMFSIAAWDRFERRLLLARDSQGIKPLYFAEDAGRLVFASEIGAIEAAGVELETDETSLETFLDLRFVPAPRTIFKQVRKLHPGHYAWVSETGHAEPPRPFGFAAPEIARDTSRATAQAKVTDALLDAVSRQMIADVPVGILLSGGVDSAVVTAAAVRSNPSVSTFCIGYEGSHWSNEFDEARRTAELLKTDHHELTISPDDAVEAMSRLIRHLEEPVVTTSVFSFYLLCEEVARHRKVVLTGQGADEPWAGYGRHAVARVLPLLRPLRSLIGERRLGLLMSRDNAERLVDVVHARDEVATWRAFHAIFSEADRARISGGRSGETDELLAYYQPFLPSNGTPFERLLAFETRSSLPENLLMLADKLSMAHGLEVRVPLLDPAYLRVVEQLPGKFRRRLLASGSGKYLHKRVCEALLPREIVHRPKKGFQTPMEAWMRGDMGSRLSAMVSDKDSFTRRYLSLDVVQDLLAWHAKGHHGNLERQLFSIWVLEEWHRAFADGEPRFEQSTVRPEPRKESLL